MDKRGIIIRDARLEDMDEIVKIEEESFDDPYSKELFIRLLLSGTIFLVAENNEVKGYIIGEAIGTRGHVISIAVKRKFRRQGVGRQLMEKLEEILLRVGVKKVRLEVAIENKTAVNFYRKLGYRAVGVLKDYYGWGKDALLMEKTL